MEGDIAQQPLWYQKTRVISLLRGVKILAVRFIYFVRKHTFDRQTDRRMDRQTPELRSQDRASIAASRGKSAPLYFRL